MLQSLKQKTLVGKLWAIIVLAVAAIFIGVVFGPGIAKMIAGPTHFTPLDDHDVLSLQGQYLEADIDTLIDYYAETVRSESGKRDEVSAREYIMPINTPDATVYIGVEVPASKIDDAEAVVADTERLIDDEDGSYEWDGSYVSVRGTLQPMDDETRQLWEDYFIDAGFSYDDIGLFDDCTALPLVLTDGEIDGQDTFVYSFMGVIGVLLVVLAIWFVVHSLTGGFQKQIRNYIKASDDPQATEQALDRFYEDTMQDGKVRMSRYVRNEDEAQEILRQMQSTYPDAMIGYNAEIEKRYRANPVTFHQEVAAARRQPAAAPAAEPTEPAQEPESKPLY